METVLKAIGDWLKSLLTAGIMSNLSGLFDAVNEQVGDIAQQVGTRPSAFEPRVFAMIESLSRNVVLPIAGIILTFIACYELIEMITQHNNMAQFEPALIMRWVFKTAISVWFIFRHGFCARRFDRTRKPKSMSALPMSGAAVPPKPGSTAPATSAGSTIRLVMMWGGQLPTAYGTSARKSPKPKQSPVIWCSSKGRMTPPE